MLIKLSNLNIPRPVLLICGMVFLFLFYKFGIQLITLGIILMAVLFGFYLLFKLFFGLFSLALAIFGICAALGIIYQISSL